MVQQFFTVKSTDIFYSVLSMLVFSIQHNADYSRNLHIITPFPYWMGRKRASATKSVLLHCFLLVCPNWHTILSWTSVFILVAWTGTDESGINFTIPPTVNIPVCNQVFWMTINSNEKTQQLCMVILKCSCGVRLLNLGRLTMDCWMPKHATAQFTALSHVMLVT